MKALKSLTLATLLILVSSVALAKVCTAESISNGVQLLGITLNSNEALIRVMDVGNFPKVYEFAFSKTNTTGTVTYYAGENFQMMYNSDTQIYEIEATLKKNSELEPGVPVKINHITCQ